MKERLVGAAVLVVLGVWLIPWLLNGPDPEPPVATGDEPLSLPAASAGAAAPTRTETIVLADSSRPRVSTDDADAGSEVAPDADARTAAVDDQSDTRGRAQADPPPVQKKAATAATGAVPQDGAGWAVQVGSFSDESNAERLSERVSTFGYSAAITPYRSGGRTLHRVRVGPWQSREEAEAVASSLGAHGFLAQVVDTD